MKSKYDRLKDLLKWHDWAGLMSDNFNRQQVAHDQSIEIHKEMDRIGNTETVKQMYEDAKPDYLKESSFIDSGSQHLSTPSKDDNWDEKFIWKIK
jgi:hypothetical protein